MHVLRYSWLVCALALPVHAFAQAAESIARIVDRAAAGRVLLVGEIHGTVETPMAVADLAQQLAGERPVIVGLEIWRSEQPAIDRYVDSAGTQEDRARLIASEFWTRDYQDGRSSQAMVDLLERLRVLALKDDVRVLAFDEEPDASADGAARDAAMAERISGALNEQPDALALILAGNFHTRVQASAPWDPKHRFMGHHLIDFQPYSIEIMGVTGSVWICTGAEVASCKARDMPANALQPGLELGDALNDRGHHGMWLLPSVSASLPARDGVR